MKMLLVGDLHLRAKRMKDVASAWNQTVTWAHNNKVDLLVQAGDVFDHPNIYGKDANVGTIYDMFMAPFKSQFNPTRMFVIPGNHDMGGAMDMDALSPFVNHPYIMVSRRPEVVKYNDQLAICSMPWVNRAQLMTKLVRKGDKPQVAQEKVDKAIAGIVSSLAPKVKEHHEAGRFVLFVGHLEVTNSRMSGGQVQAGGSFEFNSTDLASLGCDAYALAHIHIRQHIPGLPNPNDGYIGSLCQLDFGQCGEKVGCRLLEFEGRKVVKDEWLDNTTSPMYYSVESLEGLEYRKGVDYVTYEGLVRPESLPEGVVFKQILTCKNQKRMTEEILDSTTPLRKLLSAWKTFTNCPIPLDTLVDVAEQLQSKAQIPSDAVGSLDRILSVTLHNVTCHKDTFIDLSTVKGICALEGPNGSGKTTMIESIPLAFFGHAPSRKDLQTMIPQDSDGIAFIEVAFESSGKTFIARRQFKKTAKTFKHEAFLWESENYNAKKPDFDKAWAGPKIEDVKNRCISLIGDPDLVFAGIFSSQNEAGDLVDLDPSDRKELFAKLLGSDKYLVLSKAAKDLALSDNAIIDAHKARVERLKIELADEANDEVTIQSLKDEIEAALTEIANSEAEVSKAQEVLAGLEVARKERDAAVAKAEALAKRQEELKASGALIKGQKASLEEAETKIKELEQALEDARGAKEQLDEINEKKAEADKEAVAYHKKAAELAAEASQYKSEHDKQSAKWEAAKANSLTLLSKNRDQERKVLEAEINGLNLTVQAKRTEAETAKKRSKLLEGFPDVAACKACPLAKDGMEGRDTFPEIVKEGKALVKALEEKKKNLEEYDNATIELIAELTNTMPTTVQIDHSLLVKAKEKHSLAKALEEKATLRLFVPDEKTVASLKQKAAGAKAAEQGLDQAKGARIEIAKLDEKMSTLKAEFKKVSEEAKNLVVPVVQDDTKARATVADVKSRAKLLQDKVNTASRALGTAEATLVAHKKRKAEKDDLHEKISKKEGEIGVYNALSKAFSKDGIPQLIVDGAVPHYQEKMAELMLNFGNKWSIQASTQKEVNKGASIKEVFDIIVDDGHGARDIKTYSGGEKRLLKNITRIGFSLLQAERSGKGLKILALDEATENMDHGNIDSFIKMLTSLSSKFNQVFVISHNDYVLSSMPNRILFKRGEWPNEWTSVETVFSYNGGA